MHFYVQDISVNFFINIQASKMAPRKRGFFIDTHAQVKGAKKNWLQT
jgi:hypothetical protein